MSVSFVMCLHHITTTLMCLMYLQENVEQQLDYERAATESKVMEATAKAQEKVGLQGGVCLSHFCELL